MLAKRVLGFLKDNCLVEEKEKLLLGFSGGADSVCLLDMLSMTDCNVAIAYFNHQLREESDSEADFAREVARKYGLTCFVGAEDVRDHAQRNGQGIEAAARECRYRFLAEKAREFGTENIVIAHHADDQVETILLNLFRGSGAKGLIGMPYRTTSALAGGMLILRPMLDIWKDEILAYCEENSLKFHSDETNFGTEYSRNKLRNVILPSIEVDFPGVRQNILRMREILDEEDKTLHKLTRENWDAVVQEAGDKLIKFNLQEFNDLPVSLQRRMLLDALQTGFSLEKDMTFHMVEDIRRVFTGQVERRSARINDEIKVLLEGDTGIVYHADEQLSSADDLALPVDCNRIDLQIPGETMVNSGWLVKAERLDQEQLKQIDYQKADQYTAYFDAEKVGGVLTLQRTKPGMRYAPLGMNGKSIKMSDFFINNKVLKRHREHYPLLFAGDQIFWVPGFQPAHHARISQLTRKVLKIELKKTES